MRTIYYTRRKQPNLLRDFKLQLCGNLARLKFQYGLPYRVGVRQEPGASLLVSDSVR